MVRANFDYDHPGECSPDKDCLKDKDCFKQSFSGLHSPG